MAELPVEISTALVHMDAPLSFIGEPGRLHVEILPSVSLVWAATGTPVVNFEDMMDLADGESLEIQLPHTDQDGFLDGAGNAITGWYYTVKITYEKDGQLRVFPERDFQVLEGQESVDLALVPAGEAAEPQVAPILTVTSIAGFTGAVTKTQLALERVNNTNDLEKPISTAAQAALNLKAPINNPTFTGTVGGITKAMVGLGSVDNTADSAKPVSTAQRTALDTLIGKPYRWKLEDALPLTYPEGTSVFLSHPDDGWGDYYIITTHRGVISSGGGTTQWASPYMDDTAPMRYRIFEYNAADWGPWQTVATEAATAALLAAKAPINNPTFTGTVAGVTKAMVGLGSVDNTSDAEKPVSTATQTALNLKAPLASPAFTGTPTGITKAHVGLGSVDNTSDAAKPVSTATATALAGKAGAMGAWTALTLLNGWLAYTAGGGYYNGLRYRLSDEYLEIQGMVKSGAVGSVIAELPVGAEPGFTRIVQATSGGASRTSSWLLVNQDGSIVYDTGAAAPTYLEIYARIPRT